MVWWSRVMRRRLPAGRAGRLIKAATPPCGAWPGSRSRLTAISSQSYKVRAAWVAYTVSDSLVSEQQMMWDPVSAWKLSFGINPSALLTMRLTVFTGSRDR